ncbi:sensor histidine kinase [Urechidicola croceus]|uniref:Histidine kinase n=1 Tax=Urechidicola croceus TaxID=1850246 RepID=A0A1D8PB19_9FLAO|nr:histidine kinase [Urechidicola croceus]AOW21766.1 histidine kinase [Urechidicola croceus]
MKLTFNKYYLFFNLLGWILIFITTLTMTKLFLSGTEVIPDDRVKYLWAEGITCGIVAFLVSLIVSYFIDSKIDFGRINRRQIFQIIIVFLLSQILYSIIIWPLLDAVDIFGGSLGASTGEKISLKGKLFNTTYFGALFGIWLFVFTTIKMYNQLNKVKIKGLELESSLKESQLNTLKGQINPHFMFNSLNNIRGLMLEDVDKSRNMLTRLSETLRYSLTKNDIDSIALEEELEMVENYIEISKIQLEDRLQFKTEIDPNSLTKQIPPMIIQMLIENAIKHGIATLKNGGTIVLSTNVDDDNLNIKVTNSGTLKQSNGTTQLGLENIKQRLLLLYGTKASFNLKEENNTVVASIQIPMI